jgi:acetate---CoA ligase (ADP-forming)
MARPAYPGHRQADVVLRDGSTAQLRPVRPGDEESLRTFFAGLDLTSQAFRFFSGAIDLDGIAHSMATVDYEGRFGLIASRGPDLRPIGHGVYIEVADGIAEVAFAIAGEMQGHGLGTILLAHLAEAAADSGIATFVAEVLPQNHQMIEMFRESGFPVDVESRSDGLHVEFPTSFSAQATARFEERDRLAARAAVAGFLEPSSIALVGASRRRGTVGGEVLHNLVASGFRGSLFAVNPAATAVQSLPAFASVAAIPEQLDLAVIATKAEAVIDVARDCAAKGARSMVVLSAGFAEASTEGAQRELELLEICRRAGMRLIGPNCLGILNTAPASPLNATFSPTAPPVGNVGFVTQSGALGLSLIDFAAVKGLGMSSFASVGNRADVTANDLLEYWETDPATGVALLYIESFSDPRRFARVARRLGKHKPIVAVKGGRSAAGGRAAGSHTGALLAASDRATDALFGQTGVIRAETLAELLDIASLLSTQPLPEGRRVAIVTNAGGPGIMCADACEAAGLEIPPLPEALRRRLGEFLPAEASLDNPVDLIATADAGHYRSSIAALGAWEGIDALIVIFIRPLLTEAEAVAQAVRAAVAEMPRRIPIQIVLMSPADQAALAGSIEMPTPQYPEDAARALGKVARHARWRERPALAGPSFPDTSPDEAAAVLSEALASGREWLGVPECTRLLDCYGIALPEGEIASEPSDAGAVAAKLGGRVALKAHGPEILHKSELGAVQVGLEGGEVAIAAEQIDAALAERGMVEAGPELLVGVATDPVFGPVLACGAGGTAVELLGDISVRVCPLEAADGAEMIRSLAVFPMLTGFRGSDAVDLEALEALVLRVGALADAHREIVELDLNPVIASADGAHPVDARVRIAAPRPARPWPSTWH